MIQRIQKRAETNPTAESFANFGALLLFDNRPEQALAHLEEAARLSPNDAEIRNDLAVAQLTIALRGDPPSFVHAIASAHKALQLAPAFSEAQFNYALAWGALYPSRLALAAWNDFLAADSESGWASEARTRRARLQQPTAAETWARTRELLLGAALLGDAATVEPLVASFPQQARQELEETLLSKWGELALAGRQREAEETLGSITQIATVLRNRGDPLPLETVAAIRRASSSPDVLHTAALGHQAFGQGLAAYRNGEPGKAEPFFRLSEQRLRSIGSPFAGWAIYYQAVCHYQDNQYTETLRTLAPLLDKTEAGRHPNLAGKAEWLAGLTHVVQGNLTDSLLYYRRALGRFSRTGENENVAYLRGLLSENLRYLGATRQPWDELASALAMAPQVIASHRAQSLAEWAADTSVLLGEPAVALLFESEVVDHIVAPGDFTARAIALHRRAQFHLQAGNRKAASADLTAALAAANQIGDPGVRESLAGDLLATRGQIETGHDWSGAVQAFTHALDAQRATNHLQPLPDLLLKRSAAWMAQGKTEQADLDLRTAAQELERQRNGLSDAALRATFLDAARPIFDRGVEVAVSRGETRLAFERAERSRARTLLDRFSHPDNAPADTLPLSEIQRRLPSGVVLVAYTLFQDRWIAWTVRRDRFSQIERAAASASLAEQVRLLRDSLESGPTRRRSFERASTALYRELITPLESEIRDASLVVFIPDGALHRLPFGALLNPESGQFLLQRVAVAKSPSASVYIEALQKPWPAQPDWTSALILGDPDFNLERYPGLSPLPAARREAARIAAAYQHPLLRVGAAATKEVFLQEAGRNQTVFFAGHTTFNEKTPWKTGLLFATPSETGAGELLTAEEIEQIRFEKTRLVVLSACGTADGEIAPTEGPMSLARPFLAGGVPMVVGTLWDVEDKAAAELLSAFGERLRRGETPLGALRQAQLDAMNRADSSPSGWAAFELTGGALPS